MIQIVLGPDSALCRAVVRKLVSQLDPDGMETIRIDGSQTSPDSIAGSLSTPSFFGNRRVFVVRDLFTIASKRGGDDTAKSAKRGQPKSAGMQVVFDAADQANNVIIFEEPSLALVPAAIKKLLPSTATVMSNECPRGPTLVRWCIEFITAIGSSIDDVAAKSLLDHLFPGQWLQKASNAAFDRPPDIDILSNELEKLAIAAHRGSITLELITELSSQASDDATFGLVDAVMRRDATTAFRQLPPLLQLKEEAGRISAQVAQQVELGTAFTYSSYKNDPASIGRALNLPNPNRMFAIARSTRGSTDDTRRLLQLALEVDRSIKNGQTSGADEGLMQLLSGLANLDSEHQSR
jgi:DNA polymerase III delta subunit